MKQHRKTSWTLLQSIQAYRDACGVAGRERLPDPHQIAQLLDAMEQERILDQEAIELLEAINDRLFSLDACVSK